MACGISTACFFPDETAAALQQLADAKVEVSEIFLNAFSELEPAYQAELYNIVEQSGTNISALHPFTSAMETFFFFTDYPGRFSDGVKIYRKYCLFCQRIGTKKLIFHGAHQKANISPKKYADIFNRLAAITDEYGVRLCHENVAYCMMGQPEYVAQCRPFLHDAAFVLDTKQVRRAGILMADMLDAMGTSQICHLHISDYTEQKDCIAPGKGQFDFEWLIAQMNAASYQGDWIVELYRDGFWDMAELLKSKDYLSRKIGGLA